MAWRPGRRHLSRHRRPSARRRGGRDSGEANPADYRQACDHKPRGQRSGGAPRLQGTLAPSLGLLGFLGAHELHRLVHRWHVDHVVAREALGGRPILGADTLGGGLAVVAGAPELDTRAEHRPASAWLAVGHADAAGVDDTPAVDDAVELHVRVTTHHEIRVHASQDLAHALRGRFRGHHVDVVAWHGMAKEDAADAVDGVDLHSVLKRGQEVALLPIDLLRAPIGEGAGRFRRLAVELVDETAVRISADEPGAIDGLQEVDSFRGHGAGRDVTAKHYEVRLLTLDVPQHGFQRG